MPPGRDLQATPAEEIARAAGQLEARLVAPAAPPRRAESAPRLPGRHPRRGGVRAGPVDPPARPGEPSPRRTPTVLLDGMLKKAPGG